MIRYLAVLLSIFLGGLSGVYAQNINNSYTQFAPVTIPAGSGTITVTPPAHTALARAQDATMATDFCTASQAGGIGDASDCIQAALNYMCNKSTNGGGLLYIPAGVYNVSKTVSVPCPGIEIVGAGVGTRRPNTSSPVKGTVIQALAGSDANLPVFSANYAGTEDYGFGFSMRDLEIFNQAGNRLGAFIALEHYSVVTINNVSLEGACTGISIKGGNTINISNSRMDSYDLANCEGVVMTGRPSQTYRQLDTVTFEHVVVSVGTGGNCYRATEFVQTVQWKNTICETKGRAIKASCDVETQNNCPGFFTLYDFEVESHEPGGYKIIELTDLIDGFKMTDSWIRGGSPSFPADNGLYIAPRRFAASQTNAITVTLANNWFKYAGGPCIYVEASHFSATGNHIYGCNKFNINAAGIQLGSSFATITGNTFCGDDTLNDIDYPMAAGGMINAGVGYTTWTGNIYSPNVNGKNNRCQSTVANNGSTTTNTFTGNVGP